MHHREPRLVADRVVAPDFRDVDVIFRREAPGYIDGTGGHIQVERGARAAEMCPLRHGFQVVDGFGRFHLDRPHQSMTTIRRREHQIRENQDLPDTYGHRLILANVRDDVVPALQLDLEQTDHSIVLELFTNRTYQYRAHVSSAANKAVRIV